MRALVGCVAVVWVAVVAASPAAAQDEETVALVGGMIVTGEGDPIPEGTVVIRGETIVSVGTGPAPAGARVVDCQGTVITAGFVGTQSSLGLEEISLEPSTVETGPEGDDVDAIRASFSAADGYNPTSTLIPVARRGGVTSAISTPQGGLVSGTSAWVDLAGSTLERSLGEGVLALHVSLGDGAVEAAGGTRSTALAALREALTDAQLYRTRRAAFDRRQVRDLSVSHQDLERLGMALAGDIPVVVRVARSHDILRVLALAQEFELRLVLAGAEEGWQVASQIADADVPVIVQPQTNMPAQFSMLHARYDNPTLLHAAGVRLILTTEDAHGLRNLRQEAGNAVAQGLPADVALRGLTSEPARVFGLEDRYGTLAANRVANVVVWTGDPFELTTWARNVFIRGRELPLTSRQTLLRDRYRQLDTVPRGRRGLPRVSE